MVATTLLIMTDFRIYEIEIDLLKLNVAPVPKIGFFQAQKNRRDRSWLVLISPTSSRRSEIHPPPSTQPNHSPTTPRCTIVVRTQALLHMPFNIAISKG